MLLTCNRQSYQNNLICHIRFKFHRKTNTGYNLNASLIEIQKINNNRFIDLNVPGGKQDCLLVPNKRLSKQIESNYFH